MPRLAALAALFLLVSATAVRAAATDPFLWLEDVSSPRAMAWVKAENAKTLKVLEGDRRFAGLQAQALKIAEAKDRIPAPELMGGQIYNFWRDDDHVRGVWRRTTPADYASAHPHWTTVLDLDALAKREHANWVWEGADCLAPAYVRCLIALSDGGEDATTEREFDLTTRAFVPGGFVLPHSKQSTDWLDADTLLVARDWGPGTMTDSGYPFVLKTLKRGQSLDRAVEVFRGQPTDVSVDPTVLEDGDGNVVALVSRSTDFFHTETWQLTDKGLVRLGLPDKVTIRGLLQGALIFTVEQDWTFGTETYKAGSLIAYRPEDLVQPPQPPQTDDQRVMLWSSQPHLIFEPGPRQSIDEVAVTKDGMAAVIYDDVRGALHLIAPGRENTWSNWVPPTADNASVGIAAASIDSDDVYYEVEGFLQPPSLFALNLRPTVESFQHPSKPIKALPARFDASRDVVEQFEATSTDGTKIPYFVVHPKAMTLDGSNPTILYAYGGFQVSETPAYSGIDGKLWLERGGVYVLANIRGGGEFGPAWHEAALKTHRQVAFDDFAAVARDLIARKITSPRRLGIEGGSNGGLLMGVEFTQHPELWRAVDIQVPLLDMLRYEQIEAGASWVGEYGSVANPDERAFLASISPYANLKPGVAYPEPFVWTTSKDDRVGPQHARKFAAALSALGDPYLFYEVTEGGHGAGANLKEDAHTDAMEMTYFIEKLMD